MVENSLENELCEPLRWILVVEGKGELVEVAGQMLLADTTVGSPQLRLEM